MIFSLFVLASKAVHHGADSAAGAAATGHTAPPEIGNLVTLLNSLFHDSGIVHFLHEWETPFFSILAACFIIFFFSQAIKRKALIPERFQAFAELIIESLDNLVCGIIGKTGRKYTPFIATVFVFIWVQNMFGLVPFLKAPTSSFNTTFALAASVFLYVQYIGVTKNGFFGYIHHLMGSPRDIVGWILSPLMFVLHVSSELIKPVSLSLRLFGNIMGEDTLIGVFAGLGIIILSFMHSPVGIPLQFPIMLLAILLGTIQALVFTLLSTIYIFLMLPHDEH